MQGIREEYSFVRSIIKSADSPENVYTEDNPAPSTKGTVLKLRHSLLIVFVFLLLLVLTSLRPSRDGNYNFVLFT